MAQRKDADARGNRVEGEHRRLVNLTQGQMVDDAGWRTELRPQWAMDVQSKERCTPA